MLLAEEIFPTARAEVQTPTMSADIHTGITFQREYFPKRASKPA